MPGWLNDLLDRANQHPLDFGVRAGAIFLVVVGSLVLGRWLQRLASRFPSYMESSRKRNGTPEEAHVLQRRNARGRWLGRLAFACVLLAAAVVVVAIVEYGNRQLETFDLQALLKGAVQGAPRVVATLLLLPLTLGVAGLVRRGTVATLIRTRTDPSLQLLAARVVYAAMLLVGGLVILAVWGVSLVISATLLGALTLALSLALQDVLRNVFAGVYLLAERPFIIGDEITVATYTGRVEDIQLRVTSLRALDGERVLVPNAMLFTSAVVNATSYQRRRTVLSVTLPANGPDELGQIGERIQAVLEAVPGVLPDRRPQVTLNRAGQGKVDLRVIFWVSAHDLDAAQAAVSSAVDGLRRAFPDADIAAGDVTAALIG